MKAWLRDDRVYQSIMNGALWVVVIAAFGATRWPQLSLVAGSITALLVVVVATVYWIAVVTNDHTDKPTSRPNATARESNAQRPDSSEAPKEVAGQVRRDATRESLPPSQRREEISGAYVYWLRLLIEEMSHNEKRC
jgi:hypothetical protein